MYSMYEAKALHTAFHLYLSCACILITTMKYSFPIPEMPLLTAKACIHIMTFTCPLSDILLFQSMHDGHCKDYSI